MSKENKQEIIKDLLKVIKDSQEVGDMSYSTGKQLTALIRELQCTS